MIAVALIPIFLLSSFVATDVQALSCADLPAALPVYSKFIEKKKEEFVQEAGDVEEIQFTGNQVDRVCGRNETIPFVIDDNCRAFWGQGKRTKNLASHVVLAAGRKIVGGGEIHCKHNAYYLSNDSSRYCFDFKPLQIPVRSLIESGKSKDKVFVFHKQKRFCAEKKDRIEKYKDIIAGKSVDFGYKKSNVFNADQFLKLFSSRK